MDIEKLKHLSLQVTYEVDDTFESEKFIKLRCRVCHDGKNVNQSYFELDNIEKAKNTLSNSPILAHVVEDEDGNLDFGGHDITVEENKLGDGDDYKVIYLETPIGLVPETNNYAIEEHDGRNYVYCDAYVWKDYSNYAQDIIERDKTIKLSMEIIVNEVSYDIKEKYLNILDFVYQGITLLGKNYGTGMIDALATTENFSETNILRMRIMMEELKNALKGGSDVDGQVGTDPVITTTTGTVPETVPEKFVKTFEVSHEEIRYALYNLLIPVEEEDNEWYYIDGVFDDRFEYSNWAMTTIYRQYYKVENDVATFDGDRVRVYRITVTKEEMDALDEMKKNYEVLEKENKTLKEFQATKLAEDRKLAEEELFAQFDEQLKDNEEYGKLKENSLQYDLEQLEKEVALLVVKYNSDFKFAAKKVKIEISPKPEENKSKYDDVFAKYHKGGK